MNEKPQNLSRPAAIIILVVIIGLIIAGGYLLLGQKNKNNINNNTSLNLNSQSTNTSDWLNYKNEKYDYQLNYPSDWKIEVIDEKNPDNVIIYTEESNHTKRYQLQILIEGNINHLSADQLIEQLISNNPRSIKCASKKIDKYLSTCANNIFVFDGYNEELDLVVDDFHYRIIYPVAEDNPNYYDPLENYKIAQEIISTLTFI